MLEPTALKGARWVLRGESGSHATSLPDCQEKTMSAVLWANHLPINGKVTSDGSDKWALFKHADKLDKLASAASLELFSSLLDHTDVQFNIGDEELPDGMESTDELMARDGVWKSAKDALAILNGLLAVIRAERPRFGVMKNDYDAVVAELSESIEYAEKAVEQGAKFNFSVVT
jgi:hypothetical protein